MLTINISGRITGICLTRGEPVKIKTSPGAKLAWRIAAAEAGDTGYPEIEKGHLLIGILSLETFCGHPLTSPENRESDPVFIEWRTIEQVLAGTGTHASLRTGIRTEMGHGGPGSRSSPVHRSEEVKRIFSRAGEFSGDHTVTGPDLLAALVEDPGPLINRVLFRSPGAREKIAGKFAETGMLIRTVDTYQSHPMQEPALLKAFNLLKKEQQQLERNLHVRFTDKSLLHAVEYAWIFECETMLPASAINLLTTAAAMIRSAYPGPAMTTPEERTGLEDRITGTREVTDMSVLHAAITRYHLPVCIEGQPDTQSLRQEVLRLGNIFQIKNSLENDILTKSVTLRRSDISSGEIQNLKNSIIRDKIRIAELLLITQDTDGTARVFTELSDLRREYRVSLIPAISQLRFMKAEGIDLDEGSIKELLLLLKRIADDPALNGSSQVAGQGG